MNEETLYYLRLGGVLYVTDLPRLAIGEIPGMSRCSKKFQGHGVADRSVAEQAYNRIVGWNNFREHLRIVEVTVTDVTPT
jgi:hypothetical protein